VVTVFELSGRVAFVTGAGSGLGRAICVALAGAGADVACADVDGEAAEQTAGLVGSRLAPVAVDVRDQAALRAAVRSTARAAGGRLDAMCNVAGVPGNGSLVADLDEAEVDRVLAVNLKGVLFGCQAALDVMTAQGSGSIVNVASSAIDVATAGLAPYTMSKAAVAALTKVLAVEVGPAGIRVNAVAPGWVPTPLSTPRSEAGGVDQEAVRGMHDAMARMSPLGRVGTPEDIAHQVHYLVSDAAAFVTGQTLRPNGGASMPW
jgi:3-oxoacyl-[acyl-carrier protein] reductase